jgi:hypothetical protein
MASETGGVSRSPRARAPARVVASALEIAALAMRDTTPTPAAEINFKVDGHDMFSTN